MAKATAFDIYCANSHSFACEADVEEMEGMLVQAFARHREQALASRDEAGGEVEHLREALKQIRDLAPGPHNCNQAALIAARTLSVTHRGEGDK